MGKLFTQTKTWSYFFVAVLAAFSFVAFSNSASADYDDGEYVYFRIDTEIDVLNAKGVTVEWSCDGTASGSITETAGGIASESTQAIDGIIKVASNSKEMTDATCIFNTSDTIYAVASISGWVQRRWTVSLPASGSSVFTTRASMDYNIRINGAADELSTDLTLDGTTASATYSGTVASQSYSNYGGTWRKYIAGSTSGGSVTGGADGYVNRATTTTLTLYGGATSTSVDFGVTATTSAHNESGLSFGHKVQVFQSGGTFSDSKITYGTVVAGDSYGTACTMGTSTNAGYWYCPVPLADTETSARYSGSFFQTTSVTYTDRTAGSDVQVLSVINPAGNTSGGGGESTPTPTPTPTPAPTPTPTSAPPSPLPPIIMDTPAAHNFVSLAALNIHEGDTISAPGSDDPDIYIPNEHGYKRLFLNPVIFGFYGHLGGFSAVKNTSSNTRDTLVTSGLFRNCETDDQKVYGVETTGEDTGVLHWVNTSGAQAVADDANFFKKVFCINSNEFSWYQKGSDYTSVNQVPVYSR